MRTPSILSPATRNGLRDRVLADAGDADTTALEALAKINDKQLSALIYGYAKAVQDEVPAVCLHDRALDHAHEATGDLAVITSQMCQQVRAELTALLR